MRCCSNGTLACGDKNGRPFRAGCKYNRCYLCEGQSLLRAKSRTTYESRAAFIGAVDGPASSIDNDVINHARAP